MNSTSLMRFVLIGSAAIGVGTVATLDTAQARRDQPATTASISRNAAEVYRPLFDTLHTQFNAAGKPDLTSINASDTSCGIGDSEQFVIDSRGLVDSFIAASDIETCDWGIESSQGPMAEMPHLGQMRLATRLLLADGRSRQRKDDHAAAARDIAAVYRMARHARSGNDFLISALVEHAIAMQASDELNRALDRGVFDKADKALLRQAVVGFNRDDPFALRRTIAFECNAMLAWMRRTYDPAQPASQSMQQFATLLGLNQNDPNVKALRKITDRGESLEPQFVLLKGAYDAADKAWDAPNSPAALKALAHETQSGKYGPLAAILSANLSTVRKNHDKGIATLALVRSRLGN